MLLILITWSRFCPTSPIYSFIQYILHFFSLITYKAICGKTGHVIPCSSSKLLPSFEYPLMILVWTGLYYLGCKMMFSKSSHHVSTCHWQKKKKNILDGSSITQSTISVLCLETQPNNILTITFSLIFAWAILEWPLDKNIKILTCSQVAIPCFKLWLFRSHLVPSLSTLPTVWCKQSVVYLRGREGRMKGKQTSSSQPHRYAIFLISASVPSCLLCSRARMPCLSLVLISPVLCHRQ